MLLQVAVNLLYAQYQQSPVIHVTVAFTTGDRGVQCEEDGRRTDPDHNHVNQ